MKTDDIQQKIEQFANGLDADIVVIVHPKDSDQLYRWFNGDRAILNDMMFRVLVDAVENGDKNEGCQFYYYESGTNFIMTSQEGEQHRAGR